MSNGAVEIIVGGERRRRWGLEKKLRIAAETQEPGAYIREVAAPHDVYPSLLHNWRRQVREDRLAAIPSASFVPVRVAAREPIAAEPMPRANARQSTDIVEIVCMRRRTPPAQAERGVQLTAMHPDEGLDGAEGIAAGDHGEDREQRKRPVGPMA